MEKHVRIFSDFFVNFISSFARYVHVESMCTGYVLIVKGR
jgi:hypothetical protein